MRLKEFILEVHGGDKNPAALLVLRRRGIRVFPDGQRVALYTNDKYNLTFMVPFGGTHSPGPLMAVKNEETVYEYVNVLDSTAKALARIPSIITAKKKSDETKAAEKAKMSHRQNREKQLKRAMQNRQKRQHSELLAALKNRQGNTP